MKESEVTQSCPTLCDPMDCSLKCSSVYGIFQARLLEWVAISFSRGFSQARDQTWVSSIAGRFFSVWTTGKSQESGNRLPFPPPRDIPEPGIKPMSPVFPTLQESSLPLSHLGSPFNAWLVPKQQKVFIFVLWEASKSTTLQSKVFPQQSRGLTLEESKTLIFDFRLC